MCTISYITKGVFQFSLNVFCVTVLFVKIFTQLKHSRTFLARKTQFYHLIIFKKYIVHFSVSSIPNTAVFVFSTFVSMCWTSCLNLFLKIQKTSEKKTSFVAVVFVAMCSVCVRSLAVYMFMATVSCDHCTVPHRIILCGVLWCISNTCLWPFSVCAAVVSVFSVSTASVSNQVLSLFLSLSLFPILFHFLFSSHHTTYSCTFPFFCFLLWSAISVPFSLLLSRPLLMCFVLCVCALMCFLCVLYGHYCGVFLCGNGCVAATEERKAPGR